jgi:flagellar biosynthesis anti-sigma factor FlgM
MEDAMKVTGQHPARSGEISQAKAREADGRKSQITGRSTENPVRVPDRPSLTTTKVKDAIRNEPDVRADRVADVKRRILDGSYQVDAERLAKNAINTSLREDLEKP